MTDDFKIVDKKLVINNDKLTVGDYNINIVHKNVSKKVIIKIVDTTSPEFTTFEENIKIEQTSEEVDLLKYFEATDLTEVKITIDGEYDLTQEGDYDINVIATEVAKETPVIKQDNNISNNKSSNNTTTTKPETPSVRYRKDVSDSYIVQINAYRKANGLNELPVTAEAQAEADKRAKELSAYYSHDGVGYGFGEIIGNGSIGVDFITAWKNSPSHNATMLRDHTVAMAVSVYEYNNYWYAIVSFRMDY